VGAPLLRLRSDEQLVALFRAGHDEAFRVIYDRYRQRLFAYTRQMLPGARQDAEDALQDVFVRAYSGLRANDRQLALRAWLYRIAHNRCIDELRRPACSSPELLELVSSPIQDPLAEAERRESLRRLVADVRRLPEQQRSALLMRELSGLSYAQLADVLGVSIAAVKSLLVRARIGLVQAGEARDTPCSEIRDQLIAAHDRGVRPGGTARRHMHECSACRDFRDAIKGTSRELAAFAPALGPFAALGNLLFGGAGGGGGAVAAGGTGGSAAAGGALATGATHVATMLAAAVVTAGGAVEIQHTIAPPAKHHNHQQRRAAIVRDLPVTASQTSVGHAGGEALAAPEPPSSTASPSSSSTSASKASGGAGSAAHSAVPKGAGAGSSSASALVGTAGSTSTSGAGSTGAVPPGTFTGPPAGGPSQPVASGQGGEASTGGAGGSQASGSQGAAGMGTGASPGSSPNDSTNLGTPGGSSSGPGGSSTSP